MKTNKLTTNQKITLIFTFLFIYLAYFIFSAGINCSNDGGHLGLACSMHYKHSWIVKSYEWIYVFKPDYAIKDGVMYSDRLPGTAFVMFAFLYISDFWNSFGIDFGAKNDLNQLSSTLMTNLAGAFSVLLLFFLLFKKMRFSFNISIITAFIYAFASLNFQESTRFYSHQLSLFFVITSVFLIVYGLEKEKYKKWIFCSFAFLGYSAVVELQNILFLAPILVYLFIEKREFFKNYQFIVSCFLVFLFFFSILPLYNYMVFGEFLLKSNTYNPFFPEEQGFLSSLSGNLLAGLDKLSFSFQNPKSWIIWSYATSNDQPGVFVTCPILFLASFGWILFFKKNKNLAALFFSMIAISVLIAALHKTTLVRHIHTIHVFLFVPLAYVLNEISSSKIRLTFLVCTIILVGYSLARVFYATKNYWGRIPKDMYYYINELPWFLGVNSILFLLIAYIVYRIKLIDLNKKALKN